MEKPIIVLVDPNTDFLEDLEIRLMKAFGYNVQFITMTDLSYLNSAADIIVIRDTVYNEPVNAREIIITHEGSSAKSIADRIIQNLIIRNPKTIGFISGLGGAGKTTLALLFSEMLSADKSVLYLNTEFIPSHTGYLHASDLTDKDSPSKGASLYEVIKPYLQTNGFTYLPISASMSIEAYKTILEGAIKSKEYDFILVDTDVMNERTSKITSLFDKTVVITEQNENAIYRTNLLLKTIRPDYILCNKKIGHQRGFIDNLDTDVDVTMIPYANDTSSLKDFDGLKQIIQKWIEK